MLGVVGFGLSTEQVSNTSLSSLKKNSIAKFLQSMTALTNSFEGS